MRLLLALAAAALVAAAPASAATTVWAVGDGGVPESSDDAVADRIQAEGLHALLYLGDVYETGTAEEFANWYHPSFGRFKAVTYPTPGNHEWDNRATGYDPYWGPRVRTGSGHWYAFDLGGWHFVSLNSEEGIGSGSAQLAWLRSHLASRRGDCTIAFVHRPRYSAGSNGDSPELEEAWAALEGRSRIVLAGHDHNYQRFHPTRGIVSFVVGTGGRRLSGANESRSRLAASASGDFGALKLSLEPGRATYEFVTTSGARLDPGAVGCDPSSSPAPPAAPSVSIHSPRHGRSYRGLRVLRGSVSGAAQPVRVNLVRHAGRRCHVLTTSGFQRASCRTRRSFAAGGSWRVRVLGGLPRGAYSLSVRAQAADGQRASDTARFRIRR